MKKHIIILTALAGICMTGCGTADISGGNAWGVNERSILEKVDKYIHIGNEVVHNKKPILNKNHRKIKAEWIMSRSKHTNSNVIYIWD